MRILLAIFTSAAGIGVPAAYEVCHRDVVVEREVVESPAEVAAPESEEPQPESLPESAPEAEERASVVDACAPTVVEHRVVTRRVVVRQPVFVERPVVVERPIVVERVVRPRITRVVVERPAPCRTVRIVRPCLPRPCAPARVVRIFRGC